MIRMRCCLVLLVALAGLCIGARTGRGQTPDDLVKRRKADLLYSLSTQIRSSLISDESKVTIGVLGPDPFSGADAAGRAVNHLDQMVAASNARVGKSKRRKIVVSRFDSADEYTPCHILVVSPHMGDEPGDTAAARLAAAGDIAKRHKEKELPVLLIADQPGAAKQGAAICFYLVRDAEGALSVRLEFNPTTAGALGFDEIAPQFYTMLQKGLGRIVR